MTNGKHARQNPISTNMEDDQAQHMSSGKPHYKFIEPQTNFRLQSRERGIRINWNCRWLVLENASSKDSTLHLTPKEKTTVKYILVSVKEYVKEL